MFFFGFQTPGVLRSFGGWTLIMDSVGPACFWGFWEFVVDRVWEHLFITFFLGTILDTRLKGVPSDFSGVFYPDMPGGVQKHTQDREDSFVPLQPKLL